MSKDFTLTYEVLPKTKDFKKNFNDDKKQVEAYMKHMAVIQGEIDKIMAGGTSTMFASLSEAQEELKNTKEKFEEASKQTMQDVEDAWNNYLDLIDQTNEKLEEQARRYFDYSCSNFLISSFSSVVSTPFFSWASFSFLFSNNFLRASNLFIS